MKLRGLCRVGGLPLAPRSRVRLCLREDRHLRSSIQNLDDLAAHFTPRNQQPSHRDRQLESARARTAGVEVENPVTRLLFGDVAVARDHDFDSRRLRP